MRRIAPLLALAVTLSALLTSAASAQQLRLSKDVRLNIRAAPNSGAKVVGRLEPDGGTFFQLGHEGDWIRIQKGWVNAGFVEWVTPMQPVDAARTVVAPPTQTIETSDSVLAISPARRKVLIHKYRSQVFDVYDIAEHRFQVSLSSIKAIPEWFQIPLTTRLGLSTYSLRGLPVIFRAQFLDERRIAITWSAKPLWNIGKSRMVIVDIGADQIIYDGIDFIGDIIAYPGQDGNSTLVSITGISQNGMPPSTIFQHDPETLEVLSVVFEIDKQMGLGGNQMSFVRSAGAFSDGRPTLLVSARQPNGKNVLQRAALDGTRIGRRIVLDPGEALLAVYQDLGAFVTIQPDKPDHRVHEQARNYNPADIESRVFASGSKLRVRDLETGIARGNSETILDSATVSTRGSRETLYFSDDSGYYELDVAMGERRRGQYLKDWIASLALPADATADTASMPPDTTSEADAVELHSFDQTTNGLLLLEGVFREKKRSRFEDFQHGNTFLFDPERLVGVSVAPVYDEYTYAPFRANRAGLHSFFSPSLFAFAIGEARLSEKDLAARRAFLFLNPKKALDLSFEGETDAGADDAIIDDVKGLSGPYRRLGSGTGDYLLVDDPGSPGLGVFSARTSHAVVLTDRWGKIVMTNPIFSDQYPAVFFSADGLRVFSTRSLRCEDAACDKHGALAGIGRDQPVRNEVVVFDSVTGQEIDAFVLPVTTSCLGSGGAPILNPTNEPDRYFYSGCFSDPAPVAVWPLTGKIDNSPFGAEVAKSVIWQMQDRVGMTPDGRHILIPEGNGSTLTFFDAATMARRAVLYVFADQGWLLLTSEGFYTSGRGGDGQLKVTQGTRIFSIDKFRSTLFRPDLVYEILNGDPEGLVAKALEQTSLQKVLASGAAPDVALRVAATGDEAEVFVTVSDTGGGIGGVSVRVNGAVQDQRRGEAEFTAHVALAAGRNRIEVTAFNSNDMIETQSDAVEVDVAAEDSAPPRLFVLAAGVDDYAQDVLDLKYAVSDARRVGDAFETAGAGLYDEIFVTVLTDREVTRAALGEAFGRLSRVVRPNDVFVFFLAGHGKTIDGRYFFVPPEFSGHTLGELRDQGVGQTLFVDWFASIPAQKSLLMFDTCDSGSLVETTVGRTLGDSTANAQLGTAVGRAVLSASSSQGAALEGLDGTGLFTHVMIEALSTSDRDNDGLIDVAELADEVALKLPPLAMKSFGEDQRSSFRPPRVGFGVVKAMPGTHPDK